MFGYTTRILKFTGISIGLAIIISTSIFIYQASVSASEDRAYDIRSLEAEKVVVEVVDIAEETQTAAEALTDTQQEVTEVEQPETHELIQQIETQEQVQTQVQTQIQTNTEVINAPIQIGVPLTDEQGKTIAIQNASINAAQVNEVLNLTNQYRAQNGLAPLQLDSCLTYAAMHRAVEMAHMEDGSSQVSHTRPNGQKFSSIIYVYGISSNAIGENILDVYNTSQTAMNGWINSTAHRENILGNYTKMGVGVAVASNGIYYWAQLFTR